MKFLIILTYLIGLCFFEIESHNSHENFGDTNSLSNMNQSVQILTSVAYRPVQHSQKKIKNLTGVQYFWDILPPIMQVLLLQKPKIISMSNTSSNGSFNLKWSLLTSDVQKLLLDEENHMLFLTFAEWGWATENSSYSNSTLFSLFSTKIQSIIPTIGNIVQPLKFDLQLDLTQLELVLNSSLRKPKANVVNKFLNSFYETFEELFESVKLKRFTPSDTFWKAVRQAKVFIKNNIYIKSFF